VIPIYVSISLQLPLWVHKALQKVLKAFLWTGTDVISGGKCLVAWSQVQWPMHLGRLGVLDLCLMGIALQVRWLWLQRTDAGRPWFPMPLAAVPQTKAFFCASTSFVLGDGASFFWIDPWVHGKCVGEFAPELLAAVSPQLKRQRTVAQALPNNAWIKDLTEPLTVPVLVQFLQLHQHLQHFQLVEHQPDRVLWCWSSTGQYSSASAYAALQLGQVRIKGCAQL
jgi:hypothetical protein